MTISKVDRRNLVWLAGTVAVYLIFKASMLYLIWDYLKSNFIGWQDLAAMFVLAFFVAAGCISASLLIPRLIKRGWKPTFASILGFGLVVAISALGLGLTILSMGTTFLSMRVE